jgi:hypothetical protein
MEIPGNPPQIEIHGTGLAPAGVPASGVTWSSAPEFASGRMPTALAGVSVQVDGKPAYIYYVSAAQVNVLTPLDTTTGQAQVTLTNGSNTSAAFAVTMKAVAPAFLEFGAGPYIAALHADYGLLGPASMPVPGYNFTPTQPGALANWPVVTIGGVAASVAYAGLNGYAGLYQLNVAVPLGAANGDNAVVATYGGASTPVGATIAIAR